jgi:N6-adenosine-specific RNA methylase IME4
VDAVVNPVQIGDWYQQLVGDIRRLECATIVVAKHAIGKRILQDFDKFGSPEYGEHRIEGVAKDVGISKADLYRCVQFAEKFPELSHTVRQLSWRQIVQKELPAAKQESTEPVLLGRGEGKYSIIYADPPWSYSDKSISSEKRWAGAENHYPCMSIEEICNHTVDGKRIEEIAEDDAILFMWVTFPLLYESFPVFEAWGFEYKTVGFTWEKTNADGSPYMGLGNYTRSNAELCLLGRRGRGLERKAADVRSLIRNPRLSHSEKPNVVRTAIIRLFGDVPRIELFARKKIRGWATHGNQIAEELIDLEVAN